MYEAVIFDMDGIIFDSEREVMKCWIELAQKYNIPNVEKPYYACIGTTKVKTKQIMLETYGNDFPYDVYSAEASAMFHRKFFDGTLPLKKGVVELLRFLKSENKKIALASSTRSETVLHYLNRAEIIGFFNKIICGDMISKSKPDPEIFLKTCIEIDVAPENAFAIEDSFNGIKAAHSGGLRPIMVPDLLSPDEEIKGKAEIILDSLLDVIPYLSKEN